MAQRSSVPKFGNWENEGNVAYTAYFESKAKKRHTGGNVTPNDPPKRATSFPNEEPKGAEIIRRKHEQQLSREDADGPRKLSDSPKRAVRQNVGHDRSIERSPLHPHHRQRLGGKGSGGGSSPLWEKKGFEGGHGVGSITPGRSRLRSVNRGTESPDKSPAVPKFGDWDESNPSSADGYTHIFNKVREEKQYGDSMPKATDSVHSNSQKQHDNRTSKGCCCFPWGGK